MHTGDRNMIDPLEFETINGTSYFWDSEIGLVFPSSPVMNATVKEIASQKFLSRDELISKLKQFKNEDVAYCYDFIKKYDKIRPKLNSEIPQNFPSESIKKFLLRYGLTQLVLNVTEDCNFRCKYCVFSGLYEHVRTHSKKYMSFDVAKKAIDCYLSLFNEGRKYNPLRAATIGFYGGEPLLNFNLIKKSIEYIEHTYDPARIVYSMTTNGSLLDKEKADWLMQHKFKLAISLDGPEEEHNRNRVYASGKGTFKDVMKNINYIMSQGYDRITSLPIYDWKSNLFKLEEFFVRVNVPPIAAVNLIADRGLYYEQFVYEDFLKYSEQRKEAEKHYYKNYDRITQGKSVFNCLFGESAARAIFNTVPLSSPPKLLPFTGTCMPGRKIFVDVDGNLHMCQVINYFFPIGTVDEGLNLELISERLSEYFKHTDKCPECKMRNGCSQCYYRLADGNKITYTSELCKGIERKTTESFAKALVTAERNPEIVEMFEDYLKIKNTIR